MHDILLGKFTQALLGMARCFQLEGDFASAVGQLNIVIAQQPWFLPALLEKAQLLISMNDWEEAMEVTAQILQQDPNNIEALHLFGEAGPSAAAGSLVVPALLGDMQASRHHAC